MKKVVTAVALMVSILMPAQAQAAEAKFTTSGLTNLDSPAAIQINFTTFPTKGGLYIQQCLEAAAGTRAVICNKAVELWISSARGASFLPTAAITFKPAARFTSGSSNIDCTVDKCGMFMRYDHTVGGDLTEDQFFPLSFKAVAPGTVTIAADVITATINGVAFGTSAPYTLGYRETVSVVAVSKAGATLTYASLTPECALNGTQVTALKGTGLCSIAITSAGNATGAGLTTQFPIRLSLGTQKIANLNLPATVAAGKKVVTDSVTNFGAKISYKTTGSCTVSKGSITFKKGSCKIMVTAPGSAGLWKPLKLSYSVKSK